MQKRYLVLAEGRSADPHYGKTARGVIRYAPEKVVAVLDSQRAGETYDGFPDRRQRRRGASARADHRARRRGDVRRPVSARVARVAEALPRGRPRHRERTAPARQPRIRSSSGWPQEHGARLVDLREPPEDLNVPTGANLDAPARIVLTVGSDCAIGKMTVALELDAEARRRGFASVFVPTGQTGIAIAGWGIAVDAVVADFIAGAAERLVVEGVERGGELLWIEGQGSLTHPQYSGVTLGLFHGSAPHALVLCHVPGPGVRQRRPRASDAVAVVARRAARADRVDRAPGAGAAIALNTRGMEEEAAAAMPRSG